MEKSWAIVISQNGLGKDAENSDVVRLLSMLDGIEHPPVRLYFTTEGVALVATGSPLLSITTPESVAPWTSSKSAPTGPSPGTSSARRSPQNPLACTLTSCRASGSSPRSV